jgi:DNA-binding NtrC family response regulator
MRTSKILVVDDEQPIRLFLEQNLKRYGYEVTLASNGKEALKQAHEDHPDLMLLDMHLPGFNGQEVLNRVKEIDEDIVVIMITSHGELEAALSAMTTGAFDYINTPFNLDELAIVIGKALETSSLKRELAALRTERKKSVLTDIIGESRHMKNIIAMMDKVAKSEASTILIQGESGTGKELAAQWIHNKSRRAERPFLAVNCAAVTATLLESELFGYEKGAFAAAETSRKGLFELADGGTIFLDQIGDMESGMQAKLLRLLEERTFMRIGGSKVISADIRIIAATNNDLLKAIEEKSFRNDLYNRLQVIAIHLPPLRERKEDIISLSNYFIEAYNREFNKHVKGVSGMAEKMLHEYNWPGNIRELKNVIERAMILCNDDTLLLEHLPLEIIARSSQSGAPAATSMKLPPEGVNIEEVEKELIRQALESSGWNQSKAARKLNLGIDALRYRMKKFGFLK